MYLCHRCKKKYDTVYFYGDEELCMVCLREAKDKEKKDKRNKVSNRAKMGGS